MTLAELLLLGVHLGAVLADITVIVMQHDAGPAASVVTLVIRSKTSPLTVRARAMNGMMPGRARLERGFDDGRAERVLIALEVMRRIDVEHSALPGALRSAPVYDGFAVGVLGFSKDEPFGAGRASQ